MGVLGVLRRETGKEARVEVPYSKGLANHTGSESCVMYREVRREALTGVRVGQPLSRERTILQGADAFTLPEGNSYPPKAIKCLQDTLIAFLAFNGTHRLNSSVVIQS